MRVHHVHQPDQAADPIPGLIRNHWGVGLGLVGLSGHSDNLIPATATAWAGPPEIACAMEGQTLTAKVQPVQTQLGQVQGAQTQLGQVQGAQTQLAQARLTANDFVGFYETRMSATSSPGRIIKLWLHANGQARMTTDHMEGDPLILENGNWRFVRNRQRTLVSENNRNVLFFGCIRNVL